MNVEIAKLVMSAPLDSLKNVSYVENLICQAGLHDDDRIVTHYGVDLKYIKNRGMLQQPRQLAQALVYLSDKDIKKYVEIGTFYGAGCVFISSYLTRFNPGFECLTVDNGKGIEQIELTMIKDLGVSITQIIGTSDDIKGETSDLCFIDADHNYEWVVRDYNNVGKYAKIVMLHDIIDEWMADQLSDSGSIKQWAELKEKHPDRKYSEFTYHPEGKKYFGIGMMEAK